MYSNPVIIIPGIGQSKLIAVNENGQKIKNAWPVQIDEKALMNELKGSLMKMILFRTDGGFSNKIAGIADEATDALAVNPDGSKKYNIKPVSFEKSLAEYTQEEKNELFNNVPVQEIAEKTGEDKIFYFAYDFIGDVADTAKALDGFITFVKEKTGCAKVDLFVYSIGGAVLKAYLKDYSIKCDCEKVVNFASALDGASIVADVYENKLKLDNPLSLLSSFVNDADSVLSMAGLIPGEVIENIIKKSLAVLRKNILDNCTTLWSLVPADRFEAVFSACKPNAALAEKVRTLYEYSKNFKNEAKDLAENGMKFYQICGCGQKLPEVFETFDICTDGILDTDSASFGGAFPGTTWYFDGQEHIYAMYNDVAMSLAAKIFAGEDTKDYPVKNGSRNIRKLKTMLIPKVKTALATASADVKNELEACLCEYDNILAETVIVNDDNVRQLEKRIKETLKK